MMLEKIQHIMQSIVGQANNGEFSARLRHLQALERVEQHLAVAQQQFEQSYHELAAEELTLAHQALGEITGHVYADALLGEIFSTFCIGK